MFRLSANVNEILASATVALLFLTATACHEKSSDAAFANGWVTNCSGTDFDAALRKGDLQSASRPVFKINDGLILAIPNDNWPSAKVTPPSVCHSFLDLPQVPYLYFVFRGIWSTGYKQNDIPKDANRDRFLPDLVSVRIENESASVLTEDDAQKVRALIENNKKSWFDRGDIGGMKCRSPSAQGVRYCSGRRALTNADVTEISILSYAPDTPFHLLLADYSSLQYGHIHVYWKVWTLDPARALDIDRDLFRLLKGWNLIPEKTE